MQAAATQFLKALQLNEKNAKAHNNMGAAMMAMGKARQATYHFKKAVSINPDYTRARQNLANAREEIEDTKIR